MWHLCNTISIAHPSTFCDCDLKNLALGCVGNVGLFTLWYHHIRTTAQRNNYFCIPAMHFLHGLFVWTNIYEFMNVYGMRSDHGCYAVDAVTPQRPRNGPRMPKRVWWPRIHGTYVPPICSLFMVCSPFVHVLFVHGLFTVCSLFVPLIIVYKEFLPIS